MRCLHGSRTTLISPSKQTLHKTFSWPAQQDNINTLRLIHLKGGEAIWNEQDLKQTRIKTCMGASMHTHAQKTSKSSVSNLIGESCVIEDAFTVPFVSDE